MFRRGRTIFPSKLPPFRFEVMTPSFPAAWPPSSDEDVVDYQASITAFFAASFEYGVPHAVRWRKSSLPSTRSALQIIQIPQMVPSNWSSFTKHPSVKTATIFPCCAITSTEISSGYSDAKKGTLGYCCSMADVPERHFGGECLAMEHH